MNRSLAALPFLAAAALVFVCGPRPHAVGETPRLAVAATASAPHAKKPSAKPATAARSKGDSTPVAAALAVETGSDVRFALTVANETKHRVELNFPDGRTRDFAVFDAAGREVWRWSRGRLFTQGVQNKMIQPGDSVVYAERWTPAAPGRYTVVVQLRSANYPLVRQASFEVAAGERAAAPAPASGLRRLLALH